MVLYVEPLSLSGVTLPAEAGEGLRYACDNASCSTSLGFRVSGLGV